MTLTCAAVGVPTAAFAPGLVFQQAATFVYHRPDAVDKKPTLFLESDAKMHARLHRRHVTLKSDRRDKNEGDVVLNAIEQVTKTLSASTPLLDIPLGYPLALATATALFPWSTSFLLSLFFGAYLYLGRQLTQDDKDEDSTVADLAAFVGAVASAGLLSPQSFDGMTENIFRAIGTAGVGLAAATVIESLEEQGSAPETDSPDEQLMDLWDEKFENELEKKRRE